MQARKYRHILYFTLAFAAHFLCATSVFAKNTNSNAGPGTRCQLKSGGRYNNQAITNNNTPFQLVNYRTIKQVHYIKILLIDLISLAVCLKYLKNKLKSINSTYARFLKLLLYPSHVFW